MQPHTPDSRGSARSLLDTLAAVAQHGWTILLFRHHGQGLGNVQRQHAQVLLATTLLVVILTTYFAPGLNRGQTTAFAGLWFIVLSMIVSVFGVRAIAGWACLYLVTEPACLLIRYLPHGHALDQVASLWTVVAAMLFMKRCERLQTEARK